MNGQQLQSKIIKYIIACGGYAINIITASKDGVHDIIGCIDGHFFSFEAKGDNDRPSDVQNENREMVIAAGGTAAIVYSVEEVAAIIKEYRDSLQ